MIKRTRDITVTALCAAISTALLYIGTIFPTGQIGFIAATVFASLIAASYGGVLSAILVYVITTFLGFFILPVKTMLFIYVLFFGYYPILKLITDKLPYIASVSIKLVPANIALMFIKMFLSDFIMGVHLFTEHIFFYYIIGSAVFVLFDIGVGEAYKYLLARLPNKH